MKQVKKKRHNNHILYIILVICIIIFLFSIYKIIIWKKENDKGNKILETLREEIKQNKNIEEAQYKINFTKLKEKNKDTVAFLKVYGTNIEYPIVKTNDNNYYLTHSFDNSYNSAGWPFANYQNKFDDTDKNITIFAHSRYDGSMFGTLYKTLSNEWQSNKKNHKILFITEKSTNIYQVFSTYQILNEDYYIQANFSSEEEYKTFLKTIISRSNHKYNIELSTKDSILTLSSCASDDKYRIVLHAKKLEKSLDKIND